jgi:2-polyprenyl-3-methyl-5-hydroxy-6-metoxy-1,4-benzoquinol methylase
MAVVAAALVAIFASVLGGRPHVRNRKVPSQAMPSDAAGASIAAAAAVAQSSANADASAAAADEAYRAAASSRAARREAGRAACAAGSGVGATGGYCLSGDGHVGGNDVLNIAFAVELARLFEGGSVLDLGAGLGQYERFWSRPGMHLVGIPAPRSVRACDGAFNIEDVTGGNVTFCDLTAPDLDVGGPADWVMSIEVAEHVPPELEAYFLKNVVSHAKQGFVVSWALPDQPGHHHVNGKVAAGVIDAFATFPIWAYDDAMTKHLRNIAGSTWWLKNTIYVFRKQH